MKSAVKKELTPFQKWYRRNGKSLLRKRREKYAADANYRNKVRLMVKRGRNYQDGVTLRTIPGVEAVSKFGHVREVEDGNRVVSRITFSCSDVADMLGFCRGSILKWMRLGYFPQPRFLVVSRLDRDLSSETRVYSLLQIERFVRMLHEFFPDGKTGAVFTNSEIKQRAKKLFDLD